MHTEESSPLEMNNLQHQPSSFDFLLKSNRDEKWHLQNKCLFHNGQFIEGEPCDVCRHSRNEVASNFHSNSEDESRSQTIGNSPNLKCGDWKYDEEWNEHTLKNNKIERETTNSEWKCKNLYSISDLDRSNYWTASYLASGSQRSDEKKSFLHNFREYLVNYQESCGVPRTEYSFAALVKIMGQATGRSLLALLYVMLNIAPVVEVFLYILRFVLDKMMNIRNRKDFGQIVIQYFILSMQLFSVYVCLIFIFGFIVLPIVQMVMSILAKIMLFN